MSGDTTARFCSEFVEREARKMCLEHSGWKPDTPVATRDLPMGPMSRPVLEWPGIAPAWHLYVPLVKSVLEGLKEPTEEMSIAGALASNGPDVDSTFQAMIAAAMEVPT